MKRTILMTISLVALISTFIGCSKEEPQTQIDPSKCTTVTIYCTKADLGNLVLNWIHIYDAGGNLVGNGTNFGDYLVPYNGTIKISHYNKSQYPGPYETTIDTYSVGTSARMYIKVAYGISSSDGSRSKSYSEATSGIED